MGTGGSYTLLIGLDRPSSLAFGAAGERRLAAGWYAYTGSALGPGGFTRIDRHREVAAGGRDVRHWHIDYLLGHPAARLTAAIRSIGLDAECRIAGVVADRITPVPGVGASDCSCDSHLAFAPDSATVRQAVRRAHARLQPTVD